LEKSARSELPTAGEDYLVFFKVLEDVPNTLNVLGVFLVVYFVTLLDLLCNAVYEYEKICLHGDAANEAGSRVQGNKKMGG